ncbi:MAG TPA: hypothetical protein PKL31_16260 [Fulvivirga sp.]|nr:hypothetical protein [Fulvivirga sp.]
MNKVKAHIVLIICLVAIMISTVAYGQQKTDSLIINVGKSKIIFLIQDRADLEKIESYDLNAILQSLKMKLEADSTLVSMNEEGEQVTVQDTTVVFDGTPEDNEEYRGESPEDDSWRTDRGNKDFSWNFSDNNDFKGSYHTFNFDLGTNNMLNGNGQFPDEANEDYAVRPWGSWYFGINSTFHSHVKGKLSIEWGPGVSWYNFKFQNDRIRVTEIAGVTSFVEDPDPTIGYKKSKLTASYFNFMAVPMLQFNGVRKISRTSKGWRDFKIGQSTAGFRIGLGGYAGYRLGSHSKVKFDSGKKDKDRDNFNLTNFRYGLRLQMGFRGTDLFFNYDMNELFADGKGPKINAFSFGIIL